MMIKGSKWKVIRKKYLKDEDGNDLLGQCNFEKRIIYLLRPQANETETLVHEFIHAALFELHLDIGPVAEEMLTEGLTQSLTREFKISQKS